ncbi:hypothetical protein, partial [Saccharicrinis fermentans]
MINTGTFKRLLYDKRINKYDLVKELKESSDIELINKVLRQNRSHPLIKNILSINSLPKSYEEISLRKSIGFTHSFESEINWQLIHFEKHADLINDFIGLKTDFDKLMLLGKYQEAEEILNTIEKDICYSNWSLENKFLLKEHKDGVKENWGILSEINKMNLQPMTAILADNFSKRAEKKISYFRFKNLLDNQLEELVDFKYFYEYMCFRIHMFGYKGYENFTHLQYLESQASIADRYLAYLNIANEIISQQNTENLSVIERSLNYLNSFINDSSLNQALNHMGESIELEDSKTANQAFTMYIKGDYQEVLTHCRYNIIHNPALYELWEIYVKALIESKSDFIEIEGIGFLNDILKNLYSFFDKGPNFQNSIQQLLKIILSFSSTKWSKQIYNTVYSHYNWSNPLYYNSISSINSIIN